MNLLILSEMYPNSKVFLSGVFVHEQAKELKKLGVNVTVIAPVPYPPPRFLLRFIRTKWTHVAKIPLKETIEGITVYHPRYVAVPGGGLKQYWSFIFNRNVQRCIKKNNLNGFDLIHAHGSIPTSHAGFLLSRKIKVPYVLTVHGSSLFAGIKLPNQVKKIILPIEKATAIVCVSNNLLERVYKYTNRKTENYVIHNGYKPHNIELESTENEKIKLLFGGNLIPRKGCQILLEAFKIVKREVDNMFLDIAGGGPLLNQLKEQSRKLKIDSDVTFHDIVSHPEMLDMMKRCDIFVLPSWDEGFGVVYLEAMSFKKPVIATVGEGISDIITDGENGLLAKAKDANSLAEKLLLLIKNKSVREQIGVTGYETTKSLTWETNAKQNLKVYKKVLGITE